MALSTCNSATDLYQKELQEHGNIAFPIACYEDDLSMMLVPWHWHDEWELILVAKGTTVVLVGNVQITLPAGDGIFINAGVLHGIDSQLSADSILHAAVFLPRLIGGSADSLFWANLISPLCIDSAPQYIVLRQSDPKQQKILALIHKAWAAVAQEPDDYENETRYILSKAFRKLCKNCIQPNAAQSAQGRVDAERIRTMLLFIEEHLSQELSTAEIAKSVSISESVCLRCFHKMLGTTPIQYVKQRRLSKAAELLRSSSMTAKTVALECGFQDVSYFTKAFREKMGCTPKEYRGKALLPE